MTPDFDQDSDEARLLERAHWLADGLAHHADAASRRLAARMQALLSQPLSPARLQAVVAALESAIGDARTFEELTGKALGPMVEKECPSGYDLDPDTNECVEATRRTRPLTGDESFAKSKLARDLQRLYSRAPAGVSTLRGVRDELLLRRKMLQDVVLLAQLARPVPEPEGRVLLRQLDEWLRKGRRSPLLESLDELARRGRR